jgi:HEPN domain-containing protein
VRRDELQKLAEAKLAEAHLLLRYNRATNAYYLAGYAVELALKACIAKQISANTIPDKDFIKNVYSHEFAKLVNLAGLASELKREQRKEPNFAANWAIAAEWLPDARYRPYTMFDAQTLFEAIAHPEHGVLQWIRRFW